MRTLIQGGTLVTATDCFQADLLVDGPRIAAIGADLGSLVGAPDQVVHAQGLLVLPGGVDVHTHLEMPAGQGLTSSDDYFTGTVAAAVGGTTTIIDFAEQVRGRGESLLRVLDTWHARAEGKAVVDYAFHAIVAELLPDTLDELGGLVREGVSSFKLFMAYPDSLMLDDSAIFRVMQRSADLGALVTVHAETGGVIDVLARQALAAGHRAPRAHAATRPVLAEDEATYRALCLAEMAGCPVHIVHVSTGNAAAHIRAARGRGLPVHGETCPQYLFLDESLYSDDDFDRAAGFVMSPPLRPREHQNRLWQALAGGDLDAIATDHCPFCLHDKRRGATDFTAIPNGAPGIEHRLSLIYDGGVRSGRINLTQFVDLTATRPAKLFGLYPRKGSLAIGADADLVLWDPVAEHVISASRHRMRVDYSAYEGRRVTGAPRWVFSRGEVIARNGECLATAGRGQFVRRSTYNH